MCQNTDLMTACDASKNKDVFSCMPRLNVAVLFVCTGRLPFAPDSATDFHACIQYPGPKEHGANINWISRDTRLESSPNPWSALLNNSEAVETTLRPSSARIVAPSGTAKLDQVFTLINQSQVLLLFALQPHGCLRWMHAKEIRRAGYAAGFP